MEQIEKKDPKSSKLLASEQRNKTTLRQRCIDFNVRLRQKPTLHLLVLAGISFVILVHWSVFILLVYLNVSVTDSSVGNRGQRRVLRPGFPASRFPCPIRDSDGNSAGANLAARSVGKFSV